MSKKPLYKQCRLVKNTDVGCVEQTSWIPEQFAIKGKVIKIRDVDSGAWEDGWVVKSFGQNAQTTEQIDQASRVYFPSI